MSYLKIYKKKGNWFLEVHNAGQPMELLNFNKDYKAAFNYFNVWRKTKPNV